MIAALAPIVFAAGAVAAPAPSLHPSRPAHAVHLLGAPQDEFARTQDCFAAGDLVGTARAAAEGLDTAQDARPQLMWYGTRAALLLGDAEAAEAWIGALRGEVAGSPDWSEALGGFDAQLADLRERDRASAAALTRARAIGLGGMVLLLACGVWAGWKRPTP